MQISRVFLSFSILLMHFASFSQQPVCGFDILNQHLRKSPDYVQRIAAAESKVQQQVKAIEKNRAMLKNMAVLPGPTYEIPVVVHVIAPSGTPAGWVNPSDGQIEAAINRLNADFANTSARTNGNSVSIPIRFALARRTQNCVATNGIVRVSGNSIANYSTYGVQFPGTTVNGADEDDVKGLSYWPNNQVYNIWVVWKIAATTTEDTYVAGYANLPEGNVPYPVFIKEGMMILGSELVDGNSTVLAHEIGHAFGLYHTFEGGDEDACPTPANNSSNCDQVGDKVCDTRPVKNLLYNSCSIQNGITQNSCVGLSYDNEQKNIMNYGNCLDRFTPGQRDRMIATLNVLRPGLKTSVASTAPPASGVTAMAAPQKNSSTFVTEIGPWNVTLGSLNYQSYGYFGDGLQHYLDNSCSMGTNLSPATTYTISVTTENGIVDGVAQNRQLCRAWIDFNNNGTFEEPGERILNSRTPSGQTQDYFTHTATIPTGMLSGATKNVLLRMRVMADYNYIGTSSTGPLNNFGPGDRLQYGQTEDFWVMVPSTGLPVVFEGLDARIKDGKLFVNWSTASETRNDHFFVEASFDGQNFERIAQVKSKAVDGMSSTTLHYGISIDSTGTVVTLGAALFMMLLSLPGFRNRRKWIFSTIVIAVSIFVACQKNKDHLNNQGNNVQYIRIAEEDKDGTIQYSKVVKVVEE